MKQNTTYMTPATIHGIPCFVRAVHIYPYVPAYISGLPENCYPAEGGEVEWEAFDRKGYRAKWLEKLASKEDVRQIETTLLESACDYE